MFEENYKHNFVCLLFIGTSTKKFIEKKMKVGIGQVHGLLDEIILCFYFLFIYYYYYYKIFYYSLLLFKNFFF